MARDPIDALTEDLTPVRPLGPAMPVALAGIITLAGAVLVLVTIGPRTEMGADFDTPIFLIRAGLLSLLGMASLFAVVAMARPAVGRPASGWRWAAAAGAIMPAAAVVLAVIAPGTVGARLVPSDGLQCLAWSIGIGAVLAAALTWWAAKGAPTLPERTGMVIGLAAGSLGALAYSLNCPHDDVLYIGLWYTLAIAAMALGGRLLLSRFLRW